MAAKTTKARRTRVGGAGLVLPAGLGADGVVVVGGAGH